MVHLSSYPLEKEKLLKLYRLFFEIIAKSGSRDNFIIVMNDILSPPEQIMIAKRIAIIYLLTKGINPSAIAYYLKVSKSTVAKFSLLFYEKETKTIEIIRNLISKGKLLGFIEDIFADLFIQPGIKIGHWVMKREQERSKDERKMLDV